MTRAQFVERRNRICHEGHVQSAASFNEPDPEVRINGRYENVSFQSDHELAVCVVVSQLVTRLTLGVRGYSCDVKVSVNASYQLPQTFYVTITNVHTLHTGEPLKTMAFRLATGECVVETLCAVSRTLGSITLRSAVTCSGKCHVTEFRLLQSWCKY